ncbi:MAG: family 2 glycosyl transferase, partial [Spirosoma sp.]|nr:family 2 glycosyl transferase [Spirosoma sp.]
MSVVIPTYRRLPLLNRCLDALSQQSMPPGSFEIIVVDDGNQPAVAETVNTFGQQTGIKITYLGQPVRSGPAAARNRGWQAASAPVIAFTDDDCLPQPNWLSSAMVLFGRGATVVTGRLRMPLPDQPTHHDKTTAFLETAEFITANCFCLKSALKRVGGFEEAFDMAWREDSDLQFKLMEAGYSIGQCPQAVIIHPMRQAPWYAPLCDERKNRYDALLFKRHPDLFRQRIPTYQGLVTRYYATVISFGLGSLALLGGNLPTAITGFAIWGILTGRLVVERWPALPSGGRIQQTVLTAMATPFLSVYWRLYGAVKYQVVYF